MPPSYPAHLQTNTHSLSPSHPSLSSSKLNRLGFFIVSAVINDCERTVSRLRSHPCFHVESLLRTPYKHSFCLRNASSYNHICKAPDCLGHTKTIPLRLIIPPHDCAYENRFFSGRKCSRSDAGRRRAARITIPPARPSASTIPEKIPHGLPSRHLTAAANHSILFQFPGSSF